MPNSENLIVMQCCFRSVVFSLPSPNDVWANVKLINYRVSTTGYACIT